MRRAKWEVMGSDLLVWLEDDTVENREEYYSILLAWMTAFLQGVHYVLEDSLSDPWLKQYSETYLGPVVYGGSTWRDKFVLLGAGDLKMLLDHFEGGPENSWIAGLRVHAFESEETMLRQLEVWSRGRQRAITGERQTVLFTLGTYADAQCLVVTPGLYALERLLPMARQVSSATGCEWLPLYPPRETQG